MPSAIQPDGTSLPHDDRGDAPQAHVHWTTRPAPSFEQRRAIAKARERLFGVPSALCIGRFRVERRLGEGGMGEVYLAIDEALERKVAVKRVLASGDEGGGQQQDRLRHEARALAKLSHPNVVHVYETGEHEGRTFLAMEYVDGQTLTDWLAHEPRSWREILERFIAAGRGLAAAHQAGIVHRDFKPDNVLIGTDGSVRVADFGLALADDEQQTTEGPGAFDIESRLTRTGAVLGTIRYMPLEQLRGGRVDERSDQFAFCVALYEALYGCAPFELSSARGRLLTLERQRPLEPRGRAPASVWRVIRRGLARDPADRWPDLNALLDALVGRRRALIRGGLIGTAAAVAGAVLWLGTGEPGAFERLCDEGETLAGIWDEPRRQAVAARFDRTNFAHAPGSRDRVLANFDDFATQWSEQRQQLCTADEIEPRRPAIARARSLCLSVGRLRLDMLVGLLLEEPDHAADETTLAGAVVASHELEDPGRCANERQVIILAPPPAIEAQAQALHVDILRLHDLRMLGRPDRASELVEPTIARADVLGHTPLVAAAFSERATLAFELDAVTPGVPLFVTAITLAELSRNDYLVANLRRLAATHVAREMGDPRMAHDQLKIAQSTWDRVGAGPRDLARMAHVRSLVVALGGGRPEPALLAGLDALQGAAAPERATLHGALADALQASEPARALEHGALAVSAATDVWGPEHPRTRDFREKLESMRHSSTSSWTPAPR
ncbi:MAG: serine/threonine protein kinase [Deltaproteobacteria bacterium]|nr:serine/threonine protein kinase [Deltaproteobacteria bacterium]